MLANFSIKKIMMYFNRTVMPWNYWTSKLFCSKNKIKIGWCAPFPPIPNGGAVMTEKIMQELLKIKEDQNIEIYAIPEKNKIDKKKFKGMKFAKINDPLDVIFFFSTEHLLKKYNQKTKYILWQTLHFFKGENEREKHLFEKMPEADLVIAPTKMAAKEYLKFGIKKVEYVPEGIEIDTYPFNTQKQKQVLFISRTMYYKGITPFLDSVPLIVKKHNDAHIHTNAPLDQNSEYLQEITDKLRETQQKFPENFSYSNTWLDESKIKNLYTNSAVLVFPSNNEGFGIPLVEAMASGTICIVADRPPMNELVENGRTGFCLKLKKQKKYHDTQFPVPGEIAKIVNKILDAPEKFKTMRETARKKAENEYDIKKTVKLLLDCARSQIK